MLKFVHKTFSVCSGTNFLETGENETAGNFKKELLMLLNAMQIIAYIYGYKLSFLASYLLITFN